MRVFPLILKAITICVLIIAIASYFVYLRTGKFWAPHFSVSSLTANNPFVNDLP